MSDQSLYQRLGGYDAIAAVADAFLARVTGDEKLRRFWDHRGTDGVEREKQFLIDFLCASAGGPLLYTGRDMKTAHKGMGIGEDDWRRLLAHLGATLDSFDVPEREKSDVLAFIDSTKAEIVEAP